MDDCNLVDSGNGGFHSYCRSPQPTPARSPSPDMEMILELPAHFNQAIAANAEYSECTIWEQDQFIPTANVTRIMRKILPSHAKISDDSKLIVQECISEFVGFITGEANDCCHRDQRKTITTEDVLCTMKKFGFHNYFKALTFYLYRYREYDGGQRGSMRGKPLLLRRSMVNPDSGSSTTLYHHFVYPSPMGNGDMEGDASNGSTSQWDAVDSEVESPLKEEAKE